MPKYLIDTVTVSEDGRHIKMEGKQVKKTVATKILEKQVEALNLEVRQLNRNLRNKNAELGIRWEKIAQLKSKQKKAAQHISQCKHMNRSLNKRIKESVRHNAQLIQENEELRRQNDTCNCATDKLRGQAMVIDKSFYTNEYVEKLQGKVDSARHYDITQKQTIIDLTKENEQLVRELQKANNKIRCLTR
jgi:chromosome segregation ATPase